jgi:hypothetical protein
VIVGVAGSWYAFLEARAESKETEKRWRKMDYKAILPIL